MHTDVQSSSAIFKRLLIRLCWNSVILFDSKIKRLFITVLLSHLFWLIWSSCRKSLSDYHLLFLIRCRKHSRWFWAFVHSVRSAGQASFFSRPQRFESVKYFNIRVLVISILGIRLCLIKPLNIKILNNIANALVFWLDILVIGY